MTHESRGALRCSGDAICAPARVGAQPYPNKIIKLVVPFPAGGGADVLARILTRYMSEDLGQSFLIQNQPGAGGAIAFEQVARATPDGYTLVWTSAGFAVMSATLTNLAFKPENDFVPYRLHRAKSVSCSWSIRR